MRNSLVLNESAPESGVILYGPPASGKDTVNMELTSLDSVYQQYHRLKVGQGRTDGYRMTTADVLSEMAERGEILYRNRRYQSVYAVDLRGLLEIVDDQRIPVVHLGQVEGVQRVRHGLPRLLWTVVELWCPLDVAEQRIISRTTGDSQARIEAWQATERLPVGLADLQIDTAQTTAADAASLIHQEVRRR